MNDYKINGIGKFNGGVYDEVVVNFMNQKLINQTI